MIPEAYKRDVEALPPALRALLEAELAAGNEIREVGHHHPAPPVGAWIQLARPVSTRPATANDGLVRTPRNSSLYATEYTDARRHFFILDPPAPPPPEPDMDAIRAALSRSVSAPRATAVPQPITAASKSVAASDGSSGTPLQRFERSLNIDHEKWREGIGYDLAALRAAGPTEREQIEARLLPRATNDWRDVEALAALDTPRTRETLQAALHQAPAEIRLAVLRYAPALVDEKTRIAVLLFALETADFYSGLTHALNEVLNFHPPVIVEALLRGTLHAGGDKAVHFAARLLYLHGQAAEPFDWKQRPFFLRFNTPDREARMAVFRELCARLQIDPSRFLDS